MMFGHSSRYFPFSSSIELLRAAFEINVPLQGCFFLGGLSLTSLSLRDRKQTYRFPKGKCKASRSCVMLNETLSTSEKPDGIERIGVLRKINPANIQTMVGPQVWPKRR